MKSPLVDLSENYLYAITSYCQKSKNSTIMQKPLPINHVLNNFAGFDVPTIALGFKFSILGSLLVPLGFLAVNYGWCYLE